MSLASDHYSKSVVYRMNSRRQRKILELLPDNLTGLKILDVGAATGYFSKYLQDNGAIVTAIDISLEAIAEAQKIVPKSFVVDIESGEGTDVLSEDEFDYIIAGEIIEHLFNPRQALLYFRKLLKPGGKIIVTTPNIVLWSHRIRILMGSFEYTETGVFDHGHIHFFTYYTLKKTLRDCGFVDLKENHDIHPNWFEKIGKILPNIFAYALIFSAQKSK